MRSKIFCGKVRHFRSAPKEHQFSYPLYMFAFNLSELPLLAAFSPLLSYNKRSLLSLWDSDYLYEHEGSIEQKLLSLYSSEKLSGQAAEIYLVTVPRFFGYVFNPVSFYLAFCKDGTVHSVVAEVNNTFGEKHLYLMPAQNNSALPMTFKFPKVFFVSPFLDRSGEYEFIVKRFDTRLDISISLGKGSEKIFWVDLESEARPLSTLGILRTIATFPLAASLAMTHIHLQAFILYFLKSAIAYRKPKPCSLQTVRSNVNGLIRLRIWLIGRLQRLRNTSVSLAG